MIKTTLQKLGITCNYVGYKQIVLAIRLALEDEDRLCKTPGRSVGSSQMKLLLRDVISSGISAPSSSVHGKQTAGC